MVALQKRRNRDRSKRFLIEGVREIRCALYADLDIDEYFICEEFLRSDNAKALQQQLIDRHPHKARFTNTSVFEKMSYRQNPDGVLVVATQFELSLHNIQASTNGIYLILSGIEKPGNVGAMLRTADAVGANAVLICDPATDMFNPNVIRASMGTFATTPLAVCSADEIVCFCQDSSIDIVATSPNATLNYSERDMRKSVAIVIGSEKDGLNEFWLKQADGCVHLPSLGMSDSINAGMAATVMLFEVLRQRNI